MPPPAIDHTLGATLDPRAYYDEFAAWYERDRHLPYHRMLDELELELVARYGRGKDLLEVGCGTGLILGRAAAIGRSVLGVDLSRGMLAQAHARGLPVVQGSATALPVATASVDVAFCFKVLAHVEDAALALAEMARVVRPGGWVLAELYNPRSLRWLVKRLKSPTPISERTDDDAVLTRYDDAAAIRRMLPPQLSWKTTRGIRIVTPVAAIHRVPLLGAAVRSAERALADVPGVRGFGGFLVVCAQRR